MKTFTTFFLQLFFFLPFAFAQNHLQITPYLNYAVPLGQQSLEEYGLGYFEFDYQESPMLEYGLQIGKIMKNPKWDIGLTFSHKKFETSYSYETYTPWKDTPEIIKSSENETITYNWFGIGLYSAYRINSKWRATLIFEMNQPLMGVGHSGNSYNISTSESIFSNGERIAQNGISHNERISPSSSPYSYAIPEFRLNYHISKGLEFSGGIKYKPYKSSRSNYQLQVTGNGDFIESFGTNMLNDTRIMNQFLFLYAGVNYRFEFFKRKPKKVKR